MERSWAGMAGEARLRAGVAWRDLGQVGLDCIDGVGWREVRGFGVGSGRSWRGEAG